MVRQRWGRVINITMNHETMRRAGFSPYGPSKAALESETVIWAEDLAGTGVAVNGLLPGGATDTGMIPDGGNRSILLKNSVMLLLRERSYRGLLTTIAAINDLGAVERLRPPKMLPLGFFDTIVQERTLANF
jgi:3-oxoacyl-[acyl-carrier protein] reductase